MVLHVNAMTVNARFQGPSAGSADVELTYVVKPFGDVNLNLEQQVEACAKTVNECWKRYWNTAMGNGGWSYKGVVLVGYGPGGVQMGRVDIAESIGYLSTSLTMPPGACYLVRKLPPVGSPSSRVKGRWFRPIVTEGAFDNAGVILPSVQSALETQLNVFLDEHEDVAVALAAGGEVCRPQISYKANPTSVSYSYQQWSSVSIDPNMRWHRNRQF